MRKRLMSLLIGAVLAVGAGAQPSVAETSGTFYMEIEGVNRPGTDRMSIRLNPGTVIPAILQMSADEVKALRNAVQASTMIDAMNQLALKGWQLVTVTEGEQRGGKVTRWIVSKRVEHPSELLDGFTD